MYAKLLLAVCGLLLSACSAQRTGPLDHGWAPPGACAFVGNRADLHYCATTGTQLLANPSTYDGQLVQVSGWVAASDDGKQLTMFLTKDAYETAAAQGTVNLNGPAKGQIVAFAHRANSTFTAVPVQVSGRFRLYGLSSDGSRAAQRGNESYRFGAIEQISEWSP